MTLPPWEYLFAVVQQRQLPGHLLPDLDRRRSSSSVVLVVLYNVRTRALHRHPPYLEMWEWLWWTGLITFSLILIESLFVFDFFLVLLTQIIGLGALVWIRFVRFPPFLAAYEARLARERYFKQKKYADPEATIKKRGGAVRSSASGADGARRRACRSRSAASASAIGARTARSARSG